MKEKDITFINQLLSIDNGRFERIILALHVSEECGRCNTFDSNAVGAYKCASLPTCIGVTLSKRVKDYLLWKLGRISDDHPKEDFDLAGVLSTLR